MSAIKTAEALTEAELNEGMAKFTLGYLEAICGQFENGELTESQFEAMAFSKLDRLCEYATA